MSDYRKTRNYIIRVYRRKMRQDEAARLYGVVETAENGEMVVFRSFEELWTILSASASVQYGLVGEIKPEGFLERRQDHRFSYSCSVTFSVRDETVRAVEKGKLVDISRGGVRLQTEGVHLTEGDVLRMQVPMSGLPVSFPSLARVKWVQRTWSGPCQAGLQFVE